MKKYAVSVAFIALLLVACSNNEEDTITEDVEAQEFFDMIKSLGIVLDEEITNEIKQEAAIKDATVTLTSDEQNTIVYVDVLVDSEVDNMDDFTEKYVSKLKKKYPENEIQVQIWNGSGVLVEGTY